MTHLPQITTAQILANSYKLEYSVEPAPEPESLPALGGGLLTLGGALIRRGR